MKLHDLTGQRFGLLTVLGRAENKGTKVRWLCACDCGQEAVVHGYSLSHGRAKSCGCRRHGNHVTHGLCVSGEHPLHRTWSSMKQRCFNPKAKRYDRYGGRGITVCERWLNGADGKPGFQCFVEDMGPKPTPAHSIERKERNGNYEPGNCHWALDKEQARNRGTTREVQMDGETISLAEYCERKRLDYKTVHQRLSRGWTIEKAENYPVTKTRKPLDWEARP